MKRKSKTPLYAVVSTRGNDGHTRLLNICDSMEKAEQTREEIAKKSIDNFEKIWGKYRKYWLYYHATEYPQYDPPSNELLMEQFLAEECLLGIREYKVNDAPKTYRKLFGYDFYQDLSMVMNYRYP